MNKENKLKNYYYKLDNFKKLIKNKVYLKNFINSIII